MFEGLAIYRPPADHPAQVIAFIDGIAATIASVIAAGGDEIRIADVYAACTGQSKDQIQAWMAAETTF